MSTTAIPEKAPTPTPAKPKKRGKKSAPVTKAGPVAKAWAIFAKHPKAPRKDVLALCAKARVNPATAKTQYQRWLHRND